MTRLKSIITNKYLISGTAFAIWMLFFDRNDITLQLKRIREINKLQESEKLMTRQITNSKEELELLKTNLQTEKYARERYLMKKDNEDVFTITSDSSSIR